jgi:hypothetical protein
MTFRPTQDATELPAWEVQKRGGGHRAPASEPRAAAAAIAELARARQCPRRIESVKAVNINALHA